jgi:catechol 2,3-dioxygenase-like lactoylglutathione lyase family enzyme
VQPKSATAARLESISPQFVVPDVAAAAAYYRERLGFEILGFFREPPVYSIVRRDAIEIHLARGDTGLDAAARAPHRDESLGAYVWVDDLDALFAELPSRGARIVEPPTVREYHCYEMVVCDLYGFRLAFAMDVSERS